MKSVKGYKIFDSEFKCRDFQFEEGKTYKHEGKIEICSSGFHFCLKAQDCFRYYDFDPENIVCEVEALGKVEYHSDDSKACTDELQIGRRLTWQEVLEVANSGANNTGHSNSGDSNSGNWNSGDRNSGDSNSGYRNSGAFCTDNNPIVWLFDKPTKIKIREWENHRAVDLMSRLLENTIRVPASIMTDEEKKAHPKYETTEGYLKTISMHEAWENMWGQLSEEDKKVFTGLENFDKDKFKEITGITL